MKESKKKQYTVYRTGGERDGEIVGTYDSKQDASAAAWMWLMAHNHLDPVVGTVGIDGPDGQPVEW